MKDFNTLPPVTRLIVAKCELLNGDSFEVVTDLELSQWVSLSNKWLRKTKKITVESIIEYVCSRKPFCICVSKEDYDKITKGKVIEATKEEWERENN